MHSSTVWSEGGGIEDDRATVGVTYTLFYLFKGEREVDLGSDIPRSKFLDKASRNATSWSHSCNKLTKRQGSGDLFHVWTRDAPDRVKGSFTHSRAKHQAKPLSARSDSRSV